MSNYTRIAGQFQAVGVSDGSLLNEYAMNQALDQIVQNNLALPEFNRDVAQELFEQTDKDAMGRVSVRDYIDTILTAHGVLDQHIRNCQDKLQRPLSEEDRLDTLENLNQFNEDYKLLTEPFRIPRPRQSQVEGVLAASRAQPKANASLSHNSSGIFQQEPSNREESTSLRLVLIVACLAFLFELICMFLRHHFLNSLAYLAVIGIFFLNYFDKNYIRVCLGLLGISILLDLVWAISEASAYWGANGQTQHSTLQNGFLAFAYLITIILMFVKLLLGILLFRYRNNDETMHKTVRIFNLRFDLDGKPSGIDFLHKQQQPTY